MTNNVVEFPGAEREFTKGDVDKLHSEAFRDLEGEVCDLDRMGEIARDLIMNCAAKEDSFHDLELATFAVFRTRIGAMPIEPKELA